ncbi:MULTISPECIES: Ni-sirohydrochlorin a,c-diamide synthase [Methanobrevibacter]|uniref:Cobyrinate a,c-diamide synthase n=1 Tax=Methanobrevibacter gottschalkii DSM 11977 TaxID=1122229 RepID=A0A3N5B5X9_9EURY|nr:MULTISPECIES: Ni-sirohydrochlorin a,c-diamide synthase [Methanobrevibacter]OEC96558.1 cobyrinic acid a,c-diamide synthase [Methanobrevibacter sp. A27]RPF52804.1 cobyrinic acid a,c-diamide synthase [Methanobrevibacter gottschalkii DSM 11977]
MRIILAGTGSAVGKTTIATGIMKALSEKYNVQPFKVGPDYIDPSYHTLATENISRNLDSFFMKEGQVRDSYLKGMEGKDIAIIEGVRGLFEGIDSVNDIGSTASIAKSLKAPVILIINSRSLVKSAAAIVLGFKSLDPEINIAGVILNKVKNKAHYLKTKKSIEEITNTEVIGGIIRDDNISIEQRHLGLVPARERESSLKFIELWSEVIKNSIDLDRLIEIAKTAPRITSNITPIWNKLNKQQVKIGVAYDEVFNFYYKENIESLEANNAKIKYFSPLKDEELPDVDGIYIGGGYPELFSKELNANQNMLSQIKNFHMEDRPIFAECGGLMYLMNSIHEDAVVNIYPYKSILTDRVQALKYTIAEVKEDNIISKKGEKFNGHEFHYSKVLVNDNNIKNKLAFEILRGKGSYNNQDGFMERNTLASYVHTHVAAMPNFGGNFCISSLEIGG